MQWQSTGPGAINSHAGFERPLLLREGGGNAVDCPGRDLVEGRLVSVLPAWRPRGGIFHAVFPSRRGLLPAVRAFLDFVSESMDEVDFRLPEEQT